MIHVRKIVSVLLFSQFLLSILAKSPQEQVSLLIKQLSHEEPSTRIRAVKQLAEFGPQAHPAVYPLITALQDPSTVVRRNVALALGKIGVGAGESISALTQLLEDRDWTVRANAAFALGSMGEAAASAVPTLIHLVDDVNWEVCANAIKSLGQIGSAAHSAIPVLNRALRSENEIMRNNTALALAEIGSAAVPTLVEALTDKDKLVRRSAVFSLSRISQLPLTAIQALKVRLNDPEESVRLSAAVVLALVDPLNRKLTLPIIKQSCTSKDEFTSHFATYSLKRIQKQDALIAQQVDISIQKLQHQHADYRYQGAITLAQIGPEIGTLTENVVAVLITKMKDKDQKVRSAVRKALKEIGTSKALKVLDQESPAQNK